MDKTFKPAEVEDKLYKEWEDKGLLSPKTGKPFTILMPPPNANASLHAGHGMYTADDIMIRYMRLQGFASLWIPGMDHAGIETQFVYEKHLSKQGKSRMDFDRKTLYNDIYKFVKDNSGLIYQQFKKLGFLADWSRSVYTLDAHVIDQVYETFKKMESEKLVYRGDYIVNYCTRCGTTLAELEVSHIERTDPLYYMKYGPFVLATVRPETKFGDTAVVVHPDDKRYKKWIGKEIEVEGLNGTFKLKVIADSVVDPEFGTGVMKVTPGHDAKDFDIGKRHNLEIKLVIDLNGRLNELAGRFQGLRVAEARKKIAEELEANGLMEKIDREYFHSVAVCYKCGRDLEPLVMPNWFLKVETLKKPVIEAVNKNSVKFHPQKYKKQMLEWLEIMHDWPISRQNVWGIRIPVWYEVTDASNIWVWWIDKNKNLHQGGINQFLSKGTSLKEIEEGLQRVCAMSGDSAPKYIVSDKKPGDNYLPETNTFDTWFSSGQWPLVTLKSDELETRFPTDMMGTFSDILRFWISRMMMLSLYQTNKVPFKNVYLWSMVADSKGVKMSKSKGNVVNPIELVEKYGADAFRGTLFFGTTQGGTVNLSEDKVRGMRNFSNKIWNIGRFIEMNRPQEQSENSKVQNVSSKMKTLKDLEAEFEKIKKDYHKNMKAYKFSAAFGDMYEFIWHRFADFYIEELKEELKAGNIVVRDSLTSVYIESLKMLHPFVPFVTDEVHRIFTKKFILELNS